MDSLDHATEARTERHPRWLVWVCHVQPLLLLPSTLWRIAVVLRLPVGWDRPMPWWAPVYAIALGVIPEALASLVIGFVRPWGVVFPTWVPRIGGRRVPPALAIIPAASAAALLTWISVSFLSGSQSFGEEGRPTPTWMVLLYAPILLWGPLLAISTVGYCLRLRRLRAPAAVAG